MQKIFTGIILSMLTPAVFGDAPATQCPAGYITVSEPNAIIGNSYCESVGGITPTEIEKPVSSCLDDAPGAVCTMYAPVGKTFSDNTGNYQFTAPCALE